MHLLTRKTCLNFAKRNTVHIKHCWWGGLFFLQTCLCMCVCDFFVSPQFPLNAPHPCVLDPFLNKILKIKERQACNGHEDSPLPPSAPGAVCSSGLGFNSRPPLPSSHLTCLYSVHFLHFNEVMNKCALQGKRDSQG